MAFSAACGGVLPGWAVRPRAAAAKDQQTALGGHRRQARRLAHHGGVERLEPIENLGKSLAGGFLFRRERQDERAAEFSALPAVLVAPRETPRSSPSRSPWRRWPRAR